MLIGVTGDTHSQKWAIKDIVDNMKAVDVIIHLGDNVGDVETIKQYFKGTVINVRGNCDYSRAIPSERVETIGGKRIFITHGHNYDVKYDLMRLKFRALEEDAQIVLYGHTHCSSIVYEEGIWFINPGSPVLPRDGARSVAIVELGNGTVEPFIKKL